MAKRLPPHPNLKHLKNQAKALLKAYRAKDGDAVERIQQNLPRLSTISKSEVFEADVSLQETQHVIAREYGFSGWTRLKIAATFEEFVDSTDREIQAVMKRIVQDDLQTALWAGSEEVKEKFLGNMTDRLRIFVREELEFKGPLSPWCLPEADQDIPGLNSWDDLLQLTDREIQIALREIDQQDVVIALTQSSDAVKEKLLGNMSQRIRTFMEEQVMASDPLSSDDVERVQQEILKTTRAAVEKAAEEVKDHIEEARERIIEIYRSVS